MNAVRAFLRHRFDSAAAGWNRFWFTPAECDTLCAIRILAGLMLLYTHLVWSLGLDEFFGTTGWISSQAAGSLEFREGAWSYLYVIHSTGGLWFAHVAALVILTLLTLGFATRITSVLAFLIVVSYANRAPGALFGLDDINAMLAMYLMVGPAGEKWSLDAWRRGRRSGRPAATRQFVSANVAIRLMQIHLCIIYLFSGMGKLRGDSWWDGTAIWGAIGNYEYQSIDMTWLAAWPLLINAVTHLTLFWETFYCALIWPSATRPWMLLMAIPLHLGIGLFLGMMTFGLVMLIANLAFVSPEVVRRVVGWRPGQGRGGGLIEDETASLRRQPQKAGRRA